jgi:outer membrane protein insertion porin family
MLRHIGLLLLFLLLPAGIAFAQEEVIQKITILGNTKVEDGVVRTAIKSREGRPLSMDQVREDLRSIFGLGFFSDVQVDVKSTAQGKEIIFIVVEKPSIQNVLIKGNQKLKYDDIKEKVTLSARSILNLDKVKENAELIRKLYFSKGYYGVKVDTKIDYVETNEAVVTFQIEEGAEGRIKEISFKGNQKITSSDLKKVMMTKQWNILSFMTKSGVLDLDVLKNDIQMVTAYYFDHGYLEVKISEPRIDLKNPKRIIIEIDVSEGSQYRIGTIDFKGDVLTAREELFRATGIKRYDVYSNSAIRRDIGALTELFANQGYAYAEVSPETAVDAKNLIVNLTYLVEKKQRVYFEKINISGNTKTRDKVIRRELQFAEAQLYSATELNRSRQRLKRTGYFKEIDFATNRGSTDDQVNLDIKVEEAPTGNISFGVGYSSQYGVLGSVAVTDRNLFGLGYIGSVKATIGTEAEDYRMSFTDPYFLGSKYSVGGDVYHQKMTTFNTYSYQITGGDVRAGREISQNIRIDTKYRLENVDIYDVQPEASDNVKDQEGKSLTSAISASLTLDTRDDYYAPNRGSRHSLFLENAGGPLGGDNDYVKATGDTAWYFPMPLSTVLVLRGTAGVIESYGGKEVPLYEKYYVGGTHTVRGYEYGMAGPVDKNGDPQGASKMVVFNTELVFPLSREVGLRGAIFLDVGKGFDNVSNITPLKVGAGPGLRWFSPFGPINIDIGFNLVPQQGEKSYVIDFNVGSAF